MQNSYSDTICALATPTGGAIAVVRVSGPQALAITAKIFHPASHNSLIDAKANSLHYGTILPLSDSHPDSEKSNLDEKNQDVIDDVVVSVWKAPHSYTGEDAVEISCHGSAYIVRNILQELIRSGCRQARRGEFTLRAFLNGKMDLSQAEAVADLIAADNKASHDMAMSQLKGHFSSELARLREQLLKLTSLLELELDFSDHEDLEFADRKKLYDLAQKINNKIATLAKSFETGQALKKGIPVAIVGKTNVGKSTLLNQLLNEDKAIVSDIDGTTRDTIDGTIDINGVTFRFIDTAGIRQTDDKVEKIGIKRAYEQINKATVILWVIDSRPSEDEIKDLSLHLGYDVCLHSAENASDKALIVVHNKADLSPTPLFEGEVAISAKKGSHISLLKEVIFEKAKIPDISEDTVIVSNTRHYEALLRAHADITRVIEGMSAGLSSDLVAEDLRQCLDNLAEITGGKITTEETLGNIFQHFCIGK